MRSRVHDKYATSLLTGLLLFLSIAVFPASGAAAQNTDKAVRCPPADGGFVLMPTDTADKLDTADRKLRQMLPDRATRRINRSEALAAAPWLHERKAELLKEWDHHPARARRYILNPELRSAYGDISEACVEEPVDESGELELLIAEDFSRDLSQHVYQLRTDDGRIYRLHHEQNLSRHYRTGQRVRARGHKLDDHILLDEHTPLAAESTGHAPTAQGASSGGDVGMLVNRRVAVVKVNFTNTAQPSLTANQTRTVAEDVRSYYQESSFGDITTSGVQNPGDAVDVFGWYDTPIAHTCDYNTVYNQAVTALVTNAGVQTFNYDSIVVAAPFNCSWLGLASIGGNRIWIQASAFNLLVTAHELGHNLGLHHAGFLNCSATTINPGNAGCSISEYGDRYEVMGNVRAGHFNAAHKELLGLLQNNNITEIQDSGMYVLKPIEVSPNAGDLLAIKIQRTATDWLYVEYRQPIGYDDSFGTNADVYTGAVLHVLDGSNAKTLLLDATPPGSNSAPALHVGDTFMDPETGHSVEVLSRTGGATGELVVNVVMAGNPVLYGDVDLNGSVTAIDASLSARYSVGLVTLTAGQITAADVNGSGDISAVDASLIARYSVGLITVFPVEE